MLYLKLKIEDSTYDTLNVYMYNTSGIRLSVAALGILAPNL